MPFALPFIAAGAAALAGATFTTVLVIGAVVAASVAFQPRGINGVPATAVSGTGYRSNPLQLTFDGNVPRRLVYGKARISGVVTYANVSGTGHEYLYMVIVVAAHEIEDIEEIYFNGVPAEEVASGFYEWWFYKGDQEEADPTLVETFGEYTHDCILTGCAYAVVRLEYKKEVWPNGRPNVQFDVKGKKVYDPRTGTTEFSNNGALCVADYMTSPYGLNASPSEIDWESIEAAANISDQIPDGVNSNLCDTRYMINGVVELADKQHGETIDELLSACAGTVVWTEGKYRLYVGAAREPVERPITAEDLRGNPALQPRAPTDQSFNCVRGTFLDSTSGWAFNDFPPIIGDPYIAQDGGVRRFRDIVLNYTTSPITAQRLSTIFLRRGRLDKTLTLPCKWTVFNYEVWDVVQLRLPQLGWESKLFQITDWKMIPPSANNPGGIDLVVVEYSDDIYSDDITIKPIDGGGVVVKPDVRFPNPLSVLYATSSSETANPNGSARIRFDWPESPDIYAIGYELAYGPYPYLPTDADFIPISGRSSITHWTTRMLEPGGVYEGHIRVANTFGNRSATISSGPVMATAVWGNPPEGVINLTAANFGAEYVNLSWATPIGDLAVKSRILWAPVNDIFEAAAIVVVDQPVNSAQLLKEPQDGYYFVQFVSVSGEVGPAASVFVEARPTGTVLQSLGFSKYQGELVDGVWYTPYLAVPQSNSLASELGWEVFDMMVPNPKSTVEYWHNTPTYLASGTIRSSGHVGWERSPNIQGQMTPLLASARIAYFEETVYATGTYELLADANVSIGFRAYSADAEGYVIHAYSGTLELL